MQFSKIKLAVTTALFLTAVGCSDKNVGVVGKCPIVISTSPVNLEVNVPLSKTVTVTFNEPMNPGSLNSFSLQPVSSGGRSYAVSGVISYDPLSLTMSFKPSVSLSPNTVYKGTVPATVMDTMGNYMKAAYMWTFTTLAPIIPPPVIPSVILVDPLNLSTGVSVNKVITASFSMPMDQTTVIPSFTLKQGLLPITGVVTYSGIMASFTPSLPLSPNTQYTATISTGAKNLAGTPIASNYIWSFTTAPLVATIPSVISTDPINLAINVPVNKVISADFSEVMNPVSVISSFSLKNGLIVVPGVVTYSGVTASFTPSSNLSLGVTYTATISTLAKNLSGNSIASDYVWSFSTPPVVVFSPVVDLKSSARFGILSGVGVSNNAGFSVINNLDVGISPGVRSSVTGFPPATIVNGAIYASDDIAPPGTAAMLIQAKADLTAAYLQAQGATAPAPATVSGDQGGLTLAPGIYKSTSTLLIQNGNLTLDGQGDPNASWIFQIASGFTTVGGAGGSVILIGGAQAKNVFWQVGSSATIGDFTSFQGNILALTSITMNSGAVATGRMLAINGAVVMTSTNIINKP